MQGDPHAERKLKDVGWVWEGQGLDPGVDPSIFGVGDGAEYFGLRKVCYMFHPNSDLAMRKLSHVDEVVCDIAKWKWRRTDDGGAAHWVDSDPTSIRAEAELVSQLSLTYPNVKAAIHDDMKGLVKRAGYGPEQYAEIYAALKSANPELKLWVVVYTHELEEADFWAPFAPYMDVVNLWIWEAKNLPTLDDGLKRCREVFPDKPINMGCYLRDYPTRAPVPMDMVKHQWERVRHHVEQGTVAGYSILATVLIDGHQEQANWIRDFIAAH